jgi:RNA polymerase sigma-70 factor (sigma-E family)
MGDHDFQDFVRIRYLDLLRTAYLLTGSRHAAEDLVQGALVRAMHGWARIDDPMAYLRRTMVNLRVNRWRRITSREVLTAVLPESLTRAFVRPDPGDAIAQRDELLRALATLPPRMRAVLVLRYWEDLSEAETAALLRCSPGTVKAQASRGLARLRETLTASGAPVRPTPFTARIVEDVR